MENRGNTMSEQLKMTAAAVKALPRKKRVLLLVANEAKLKELVAQAEAPSFTERLFGSKKNESAKDSESTKDSESAKSFNSTDYARYAGFVIGAVPLIATLPATLPVATLGLGGLLGKAAYEHFYPNTDSEQQIEVPISDLVERYTKKMEFPEQLVLIDPTVARDTFFFENEHVPGNGCFYMLHPFVDDLYIRVSEYPKIVEAELLTAFNELASELGANSITLVHEVGFDKKASGSASVPVNPGASLGGGASYEGSGSNKKSRVVKYGPKDYAPRIPERLKVWVHGDSHLRSMAHSRIADNALSDRVEIETSDHIGLGAEFMASVSGLTGDAKAKFSKSTNSKFIYDVEYHPI